MNNKTKCIREIENWSLYKNEHKLDHVSYNPKNINEQLYVISPKIDELIKNIEKLDKKDLKEDGKLYKHFIFSELKSYGGAKSVASALISKNFKLIYDNKLTIKEPIEKDPYNFALLTSTKLYNKTVGVKLKRTILDLFNKRPDNINGDNVRFIVLDSGYKEGIDLFDIKYVHILETPFTNAETKQIIGRGTRFCGQNGLNFEKDKGWTLNVYQYRTMIPEEFRETHNSDTLFELLLKYSNIDATKNEFANSLDKVCIQSSVDINQNKNIHISSSYFKDLYDEVFNKHNLKDIEDINPKTFIKYGLKINIEDRINCRAGCKGKAMALPSQLMLIIWYMMKDKPVYVNEKRYRPTLCKYIMEDKKYCERINIAWKDVTKYLVNNEDKIKKMINKVPSINYLVKQKKDMYDYLQKVLNSIILDPIPPLKHKNYEQLQRYIYRRFKQFSWDKPVIKNECMLNSSSKKEEIVEFTPAQEFVRHYFQPESIYKGLLLWHSVGTGKTCTAIATATTSFEEKGYNILWVTRHTLKSDIWKNMYEQVCSLKLRENKPEDYSIEEAMKSPMKYVSSNWIEPITYKQFSNLLMKKNKYYDILKERNGEEDILKNTLIIIDEAHKILSSDLPSQERPNYNILKKYIHDSYTLSGKNSAKVLLMSATPYTEEPMNMIKLINLLKHGSQLPEDYDTFKELYLNDDGTFKNSMDFISEISGYISYLNRSNDARQFAIPVINTIDVDMSRTNVKSMNKQLDNYRNTINRIDKNIEKLTASRKDAKADFKEQIYDVKDYCDDTFKVVKEINACKKEETRKIKSKEKEYISKIDNQLNKDKNYKRKTKKNMREQVAIISDYKNNDPSQERLLIERCGVVINK